MRSVFESRENLFREVYSARWKYLILRRYKATRESGFPEKRCQTCRFYSSGVLWGGGQLLLHVTGHEVSARLYRGHRRPWHACFPSAGRAATVLCHLCEPGGFIEVLTALPIPESRNHFLGLELLTIAGSSQEGLYFPRCFICSIVL